MTDQRLPRNHRIRRTADFQRAYRRRCMAGDQTLLVFAHDNGLPHARLGLSVSRKVGNAVQRNRWKRLLREAFRMEQQALPAGIDLVAIPRPDAEPSLAALRRSLRALARIAAGKLARARMGGRTSSRDTSSAPNKDEDHAD